MGSKPVEFSSQPGSVFLTSSQRSFLIHNEFLKSPSIIASVEGLLYAADGPPVRDAQSDNNVMLGRLACYFRVTHEGPGEVRTSIRPLPGPVEGCVIRSGVEPD